MKLTEQQIQKIYDSLTGREYEEVLHSILLPGLVVSMKQTGSGQYCSRIFSFGENGPYLINTTQARAIITYCEKVIGFGDEAIQITNNAVSLQIESDRKRRTKENPAYREQWERRGFVYVVRFGGHYKIGKALDITSRMKAYITENPNDPEDIRHWEVERYSEAEAFLHNHFQEKRIKRKEWFSLTHGDIESIPVILSDFLVRV